MNKNEKELIKYWLLKLLNKEITKTEMYFIIDLEKMFEITEIKAKTILKKLMNDEIKEVAVFTKYRIPYTLNLFREGNEQKIILMTVHKYFNINSEIEKIFNFLNKRLNLITDLRCQNKGE